MSRIQDAVAAKLPASNIPLPTVSDTPTPAYKPTYSDYVAQIEANKGPSLAFRGSRIANGLQAPVTASTQRSLGPQKTSFVGISGIGQRGYGDSAQRVGGISGIGQAGFGTPSPATTGPDLARISNVYRYIANYNRIDPSELAGAISGSEIVAKSPIVDGHNYFMDYINGVAAPASAARPITAPISAPTPVQSSGILGASSQGTGNFLDNTPSPQGFSMGGLVTSDQSMQTPLLASYATGGMVGQPPAGLAPPTGAPWAPCKGSLPLLQLIHRCLTHTRLTY